MLVAQLCLTLCDSPGSSDHEILQARILECCEVRARLPFTRSPETPTRHQEGPGFSEQGKVLLWTLSSRPVREDSDNCLESIRFSVLIERNMESWVIEGAGSLPLL